MAVEGLALLRGELKFLFGGLARAVGGLWNKVRQN
jgi:hypothetical protein